MWSPRFPTWVVLGTCCLGVLLLGCGKDSTPPDFTRPAAVNLSEEGTTSGSITLRWLAPGDDGVDGRASRYDIRYSPTTNMTPHWWDSVAVVIPNLPSPQPPGILERVTISGLEPRTTYYIALKTADEVPNWSAISNVLAAETDSLLSGR